jgi:flavin reductase (DIM6/NTAB) family NADH-FMN oxidoreductase RutF
MEEIPEPAAAVGKIPSGLFVVTACEGDRKEGYLGSWIQQASFSPLLLNLAIRPGRPCYDLIHATRRLCINVVGHKNGGLMKPFWSPSPDVDAFAGLEWSRTGRGNIAMGLALAYLECELRSSVTPGDHEILFVEVVGGKVLQAEDKPLAHVRKSGLGY